MVAEKAEITILKDVWNIILDQENLSLVWVTQKYHIKTLFQTLIAISYSFQETIHDPFGQSDKIPDKFPAKPTVIIFFKSQLSLFLDFSARYWAIIPDSTMLYQQFVFISTNSLEYNQIPIFLCWHLYLYISQFEWKFYKIQHWFAHTNYLSVSIRFLNFHTLIPMVHSLKIKIYTI